MEVLEKIAKPHFPTKPYEHIPFTRSSQHACHLCGVLLSCRRRVLNDGALDMNSTLTLRSWGLSSGIQYEKDLLCAVRFECCREDEELDHEGQISLDIWAEEGRKFFLVLLGLFI
jgi:hypothetical protein